MAQGRGGRAAHHPARLQQALALQRVHKRVGRQRVDAELAGDLVGQHVRHGDERRGRHDRVLLPGAPALARGPDQRHHALPARE